METTQDERATTAKAAKKSPLSANLMLPICILIISFAVFLLLNPSNVLPRTTLYFDASHYLETTKRLYETMRDIKHLSRGMLESLSFYLMLDGPILPLTGALAFFVAQKAPSPADWSVLVTMQCFIQSLGCLFIFLLGKRLFRSTKLALIGAVAWMTYPPAISSCNTFLTEPLACTLSIAMLYYLSDIVPTVDNKFCGLLMRRRTTLIETSSKMPVGAEGAEEHETEKKSKNGWMLGKAIIAGALWASLCLLKPALFPAATLIFLAALASTVFSHDSSLIEPHDLQYAREQSATQMKAVETDSSSLLSKEPDAIQANLEDTDKSSSRDRSRQDAGAPGIEQSESLLIHGASHGRDSATSSQTTIETGAIPLAQASRASMLSPRNPIAASEAIAGALIVILPWLVFGFYTTQNITLLPSRRPVYNILTGCNMEGDGWGCYPTHPLAEMYPEDEPAAGVAVALMNQDPAGFANLTLRKITRLWNIPWNDYRYKILGLTFKLQAIYQAFLALSGIAGMIVLLSQLATTKYTSRQIFIALSLAILTLGHLIYLPFEGISRYGFTAMPFIILCAIFLFKQAATGTWRKLVGLTGALAICIATMKLDPTPFVMEVTHNINGADTIQFSLRLAAIALLVYCAYKSCNFRKTDLEGKQVFALLALLAFITSGAICAAFAMSKNETHMWSATLKSDMQVERSIFINDLHNNSAERTPHWALLLIDGNENIGQVSISVNDQPVQGKLASIYQFDPKHYDLEDWLNQFSSLIRKQPNSLPRWRAVEIPLTALKTGWNKISLRAPESATGKVTIYGDYRLRTSKNKIVLPSPEQVSPGKFFNDSDDIFDSRIAQETYSTPSPSRSTLIHERLQKRGDLSSAPGLQTGEYRLFLMVGYANDPSEKEKTKATAEDPALPKTPKQRPPFLQNRPITQSKDEYLVAMKGKSLHEFAFVQVPDAASASPFATNIDIPEHVLTNSHLKVVISGESKPDGGIPAQLAVSGVVTKKNEFIANVLPGTPQLINTSDNWAPFSVTSEIPTSGLKGQRPILRVELKTNAGKAFARKLFVRLSPLDKPQITGHSIKIY